MRRLILGTAGHIDHGKTALVRALTGTDTDRLKEEKARGITIELGFAELDLGSDLTFGVVDVPGHEGFIRTMVAGATGMDVVLMVVAADEGVMPQTREHLAIVRLLGVDRLAVALTKCDLVEEEWLELVADVADDVGEVLGETRFADAPIVATSTKTGEGLDELRGVLGRLGDDVRGRDSGDIPRLPVDRVFTVRGTGTVITGTLWSGTLEKGQRIRVEPNGPAARIRGLQVHGKDATSAGAGERTAVALAGPDVGRGGVIRGQSLVADWPASLMLTVRLTVLPDSGWQVEHGQRLRIHAGTAEVMARCVAPDGTIPPGGAGWVQLRLEQSVVARGRDRLIIRSYSPVTTIGGAVVVEPHPPKRSRFTDEDTALFEHLLSGGPGDALSAAMELAGWEGLAGSLAPVATGLAPPAVAEAFDALEKDGALEAGERFYAAAVVEKGEEALETTVGSFHRQEPLKRGVPLEILRQSLPRAAPAAMADAVLRRLEAAGRLIVGLGTASLPDFELRLSPDAEGTRDRLRELYRSAGLAPPSVKDLPESLRTRTDFDALMDLLLADGSLRVLDAGLYIWSAAVDETVHRITEHFGGREGLSPGDFREVVPVTRKHLMPLLGYLDGLGVTTRTGDVRSVRPAGESARD